MTADSSLPRKLINAVASDAQSLGWFDNVITHEPKSAPSENMIYAVTAMQVTPYLSGLVSTTLRVELAGRIYVNMLREPQGDIDGDLMQAAWDLFARYSSGFTLGGLIRNVDLLGEAGQPLDLHFGYVPIDKRLYRSAEFTITIICNDVMDQGA